MSRFTSVNNTMNSIKHIRHVSNDDSPHKGASKYEKTTIAHAVIDL